MLREDQRPDDEQDNVDGVASLEAALDEDVADQYFDTGHAAMEMNSTGGLTGNLALDFDLGVAPLPCDEVCAAPIGGATLGLVASAPEKIRDGAWSSIEYVTTPENSAFIFTRTGYPPIIEGALETETARESIEANPEHHIANEQFDVAFARARPPAVPAIRAEEPAVWQSIVLQEQTAVEALSAFADQMRGTIATN